MSIHARLDALGITLPPLAVPAAAYVPFVRSGKLVFISGHIARRDGKPWVGQLGLTWTPTTARRRRAPSPSTCWARCRPLRGELDRVARIVKVMSLVNSTSTFTEQHLVTNGCSELLAQVFGAESARMRAAPSAWRRSRWAPASRSN